MYHLCHHFSVMVAGSQALLTHHFSRVGNQKFELSRLLVKCQPRCCGLRMSTAKVEPSCGLTGQDFAGNLVQGTSSNTCLEWLLWDVGWCLGRPGISRTGTSHSQLLPLYGRGEFVYLDWFTLAVQLLAEESMHSLRSLSSSILCLRGWVKSRPHYWLKVWPISLLFPFL